MVSTFNLKVERIEQRCVFELSWGQSQQLRETLAYPDSLSQLYQHWQQIYLEFYKRALRGRRVVGGRLAPTTVDWHAKLVEAETQLLSEFHHWLRSRELTDIRDAIVQAAITQMQDPSSPKSLDSGGVDIFVCANPIEVARLPWEAWEISSRFASKIRIARTCRNILEQPVHHVPIRPKARVLAILGDDRGLDFQREKKALASCSKQLEVELIGWQGQSDTRTPAQLRTEIATHIADPKGWDILFFAGHSNEATGLGGELAIAPNVSLFLNELQESLKTAIQQGLQFAIFNSCKGLNLAESLISLGLNQVAVMREPIHNQVAEEFLVRFLNYLVQHQDAHDALLSACRSLKSEQQYTYPSASLIPSFCRHPGATVYHLPKHSGKWFGKFRQQLKPILPSKKEAITLGALLLASWQLNIQGGLLDQRVYLQARYRQLTQQVDPNPKPPVLVVAIGEESIRQAGISDPRPMNRQYLAGIIQQLNRFDTKVVGIDYLLDRPAKDQGDNDQILAQAVQQSVVDNQTLFVFASKPRQRGLWWDVIETIAQPQWSLQGSMQVYGEPILYMSLLPMPNPNQQQRLPLSYLLALGYWMNFEATPPPVQPNLTTSTSLLSQLKAHVIDTTGDSYQTLFSNRTNLHPLTNWAYLLGQWWLHPMIDYSIPPDQVYSVLPAWQLLSQSDAIVWPSEPQVVLIAPWGYGEAGVDQEGEDNFSLPAAVAYWRDQRQVPMEMRPAGLPGAEAHAYMVHHFLHRQLVVPIPDIWMILLAAILGKSITLVMRTATPQQLRWVLLLGPLTLIYGLLTLQLYISGQILLPWFFPTVTIWADVMFALLEKKSYG